MSDNEKVNEQEAGTETVEVSGPNTGEQVICIQEADEDSITLFGKGEYLGDREIPEGIGGLVGAIMSANGKKAPAVKLESGETLYGIECHIGPVDGYEEWKGDREEKHVSVDEYREAQKQVPQADTEDK